MQISFLSGPENPLLERISELEEKQNNLRRGLFQRFEDLKKEVCILRAELLNLRLHDDCYTPTEQL